MNEQTNKQLDARLQELHGLNARIETLTAEQESLRKEIFGIVENEGLTDGYKNSLATVSYVERKSIRIADEPKLLEELAKERLVKYFKIIPQQVIAEHAVTTAEFMKDVKAGKFSHPSVEVQTATNLAVRFTEEAA